MLISFFISPVFATEINNPATCDSGTLSTDTGPTNLRANYESNTLNLKWYDENGNQLNVQNESNTCTYGGSINLPTPPEKKGYTFKGWKVFYQYDFSTLPTSENGLHRWARGVNPDGSYMCRKDDQHISTTTRIECDNEFADLNEHEWKVEFSYGTVYGQSLCSNTPYNGSNINETQGSGIQCWCKATGFIPYSSNIQYVPLQFLLWRHYSTIIPDGNNKDCINRCSNQCAYAIAIYDHMRQCVFNRSCS